MTSGDGHRASAGSAAEAAVPSDASVVDEPAEKLAWTATLDVVPLGVLVVDPDGQAIGANRGWRDLTGLSELDSLGHQWLCTLDPGDGATILGHIRDAASNTSGTHVSDHGITIGGRRSWTRWWIRAATLDSPTRVILTVADTEADHEQRSDLHYRATHDQLTGLTNRAEFFELLDRALRHHRRRRTPLAVLFVDLDRFKDINDALGHAAGDEALGAVGALLEQAVRPGDIVARVGGDEFAILCEHLDRPADATAIAERVRATLTTLTRTGDRLWPITATVGLALADGNGDSARELLHRADRAMYQAKIVAEPIVARDTAGDTSDQRERSQTALTIGAADALVNELFAVGLSLASCRPVIGNEDAARFVDDATARLDRAINQVRIAALNHHHEQANRDAPVTGDARSIGTLTGTLRQAAAQVGALTEHEHAGSDTFDLIDAAHGIHRAMLAFGRLSTVAHPTSGSSSRPTRGARDASARRSGVGRPPMSRPIIDKEPQ